MVGRGRSRLEQIEIATLRFVARFTLYGSPVSVLAFGLIWWRQANPLVLVEGLLVAAYTALVWVPGISHRLRAFLFASVVNLVAALALFNFGPTLGTGTFVLAGTTVSSFFFGLRGGLISALVLCGVYILIGWACVQGAWVVPTAIPDPAVWVRMGASCIVPVVALSLLLERMRTELVDSIDLEQAARERERATHEDFAFMVSHDLSEPVRTVRGITDVVLEDHGAELSDEAASHLRLVRDAGTRMAELIDGLVRYTRLGAPEPLELVDPAAVAADAARDLTQLISDHDASIDVCYGPKCLASPRQLRQVFANLIANAIKYQRKDISPRVIVNVDPHGTQVQVTITDNGRGVPEEQREKVFDAFRRGTRSEGVPGSGMGLAIVRRIVQQHGGRIWIEESPNGPGTRVVVELQGAG